MPAHLDGAHGLGAEHSRPPTPTAVHGPARAPAPAGPPRKRCSCRPPVWPAASRQRAVRCGRRRGNRGKGGGVRVTTQRSRPPLVHQRDHQPPSDCPALPRGPGWEKRLASRCRRRKWGDTGTLRGAEAPLAPSTSPPASPFPLDPLPGPAPSKAELGQGEDRRSLLSKSSPALPPWFPEREHGRGPRTALGGLNPSAAPPPGSRGPSPLRPGRGAAPTGLLRSKIASFLIATGSFPNNARAAARRRARRADGRAGGTAGT